MKIYFLPMLLSLFFLGACDKNDEIIPENETEREFLDKLKELDAIADKLNLKIIITWKDR